MRWWHNKILRQQFYRLSCAPPSLKHKWQVKIIKIQLKHQLLQGYSLYVSERCICGITPISKQINIIPFPKVGKVHHSGSSYCLISLLCPAIEVRKRLILPLLTIHLNLSETQHGFRKHGSMTSALLPLAYKVATGTSTSLSGQWQWQLTGRKALTL